VLPGLVTFAAAIAVPAQFGNLRAWLVSLFLMTGLLTGVLVAEHGTAQLEGQRYRLARLGLLGTTWLLAAVVALVLGELTWALNALGLSALAGGSLLLLVFYTFTGVAQQALAGRLNRRIVLEFGAVAAAGLLLLWLASRPAG
jgi:hypothetical protein